MAAALREIGKQDIEGQIATKAGETRILPPAQKMGKILDRCGMRQVRTELVEGLGNAYGFDMARKKPMEDWLVRALYYMFFYDRPRPFQAQLGVMAFLEAHE